MNGPKLQDAYLRAWLFAAQAHQGQKVPGGELPYVVHLGLVAMEVLAALAQEQVSDPALAVQCALLHDSVEDTATTRAQIEAAFGAKVAAGVAALSKDASLPKAERMAESLARIRAQPREVWMVKLADRITNLQPPPAHWPPEKIAAYREEARVILRELGAASALLAARLEEKIVDYAPGSLGSSPAARPPG